MVRPHFFLVCVGCNFMDSSLTSEPRGHRRSWHELGSMASEEAQEEFVRHVLQLCESLDFETDVVNFLSELYVLLFCLNLR